MFDKIPAELSFESIYFPPFLLTVSLGFLCAFCLSKVLHISGFSRFFWHDGLTFVAFWILSTSLIGLLLLQP